MGHRRTDLTTVRYSRFGAWESQWVSRTNYNSLLFQDFQINRYILGIFYKLRYPTSAIKIKRFSMNMIIIATTVYVPMTVNIGLRFFNSDYMATLVVYMYRLLKFHTYVSRATRTAGVVIGSARSKQLAYLYGTGHVSSISFEYRMQLYYTQYIRGLHALDQVLICGLLVANRKNGVIVSNTVFLGKMLQTMFNRVIVHLLPMPTHEVLVHTQSNTWVTQRIVQYNHRYVEHSIADIEDQDTHIAENKLIDLRSVARSHRKKYKSGINIFIDTANDKLQQSVFARFEHLFDEIKACYSRLSFLYYRYVGLIDSSETIMFALVHTRIALSRLERLLRYMRTHIKRSYTQNVISRARVNAMYGALGTFTRIAQHVRLGALNPDLDQTAHVAVEDQWDEEKEQRVLQKIQNKSYYYFFSMHADMTGLLYRLAEKTTTMSYVETKVRRRAKALSKFVIGTNGLYTAYPYLATHREMSRATRSKRILNRMARSKDTIRRLVRHLWNKETRGYILPEALSTISFAPISKKYFRVLLRGYLYHIKRVRNIIPKGISRKLPIKYRLLFVCVHEVEEWCMHQMRTMRRTMSSSANTLNGVGLFRVKHILLGVRKQYKAILWYERRILRMRIRTKHILLNAISEYGRVHPPLVDTILVRRNILMVLAGQLMRITARMDLRVLDNIVASSFIKSTIGAGRKKRKWKSKNGQRLVRKKRGVSRGRGLMSNIMIALQQTASSAVSVRTMYSGLSRLQNFVAVLKRRLRRSIIYYTKLASEYVKKMGLIKLDMKRALGQINKETSMSLLIQQHGYVHSIVRAFTNYSYYTKLVDMRLVQLTDSTTDTRLYNRPSAFETTIYKPVFKIAHSNSRAIMSAITNVSVDLLYICARLGAFMAYTARIVHRALLSRLTMKMPIRLYVNLLGQLNTMNASFVKYTSKVKHVQEYIYLTKVRMRYATILGQNGIHTFISRLGRIFYSRQKQLYSGERWLFVKLDRVTQVMMHKWFIDTLTVFNLYMEDTLSRYLNMRVLLILNFFRERLKRWNPRIFIDRIGMGRKNQKQLASKRKKKFPPMISAKLLCEYVRNRIERGSYMNRIFRDIRYWQKLELRKLNRLQHRSPKTFYRIEKKYPLDGIRILISGPRKKAKRKKRVYYHIWLRMHDYSRRMPLQTVNRNIEYHKLHARRRASAVGVKVWLAFRSISQNAKKGIIGT